MVKAASPPSPSDIRIPAGKIPVVIAGGGLAGALTALELVNDPNSPYFPIIMEKQKELFSGSSMIAAREHQGGEYWADPKTRTDCFNSAVVQRWLLPEEIYTSNASPSSVPKMKFLIAASAAKYEKNKKKTMLSRFEEAYEAIRVLYEKTVKDIAKTTGMSEADVQKNLFGSYQEGEFFRLLSQEELSPYPHVEGGFQTQERGINIPTYLATLEYNLKKLEQEGRIKILTQCKVVPNGIERNNDGTFLVEYEDDSGDHKKRNVLTKVDQVVLAAYQGGPEVKSPFTGRENKKIYVDKRAMLLIDLPAVWKTPPAFIMQPPVGAGAVKDKNPGFQPSTQKIEEVGGMIAPFNDRKAICYLPVENCGWMKTCTLDKHNPLLPSDWNKPLADEKKYAEDYFKALSERFPELKDIENPHYKLIVRDTIRFNQDLDIRPDAHVQEGASFMVPQGSSMIMAQQPQQRHEMRMQKNSMQEMEEPEPGLFFLYPTKATYAMRTALQTRDMVERRTQKGNDSTLLKPDKKIFTKALKYNEKYTLKGLEIAPSEYVADFCSRHLPLDSKMAEISWGQPLSEMVADGYIRGKQSGLGEQR